MFAGIVAVAMDAIRGMGGAEESWEHMRTGQEDEGEEEDESAPTGLQTIVQKSKQFEQRYRGRNPSLLEQLASFMEEMSLPTSAVEEQEAKGPVGVTVHSLGGSGQRNQKTPREGSVWISTVHKAKGLQWPAVFVIGTLSSVYSNARDETDQRDDNRSEEAANLLYVAMSRAQQYLYLTYEGKTTIIVIILDDRESCAGNYNAETYRNELCDCLKPLRQSQHVVVEVYPKPDSSGQIAAPSASQKIAAFPSSSGTKAGFTSASSLLKDEQRIDLTQTKKRPVTTLEPSTKQMRMSEYFSGRKCAVPIIDVDD